MPFDGKDFPGVSMEIAILDDMRRTLAKPRNWCKGKLYSRTWYATHSFCLLGALNRADHGDYNHIGGGTNVSTEATLSVRRRLCALIPQANISDFNDCVTTKHSDVLDLIDRAIISFVSVTSPHDFHGSTITNAPFNAVLAAADQKSSKTLSLA